MLKNIMETVVEQKFSDLTKDSDFCTCQQCREDVLAYALNHLPPHYVSTSSGELFSRVRVMAKEAEHDTIFQLAKAMKLVRDHPHHADE